MVDFRVNMLGNLDIVVDGNSLLPLLGNSTKSLQLIKFLLLNHEKHVPSSELIDLFWAESEKSSNPENALKTMISRIRSNMSKAHPSLKNCILSDTGTYYWNPEIPCYVDAFVFEERANTLLKQPDFNDEIRAQYMYILDLYGGDISYSSSDEDWVVSRSLYLHSLYLKTIYRFIDHLKRLKDYETLIHVCRTALDIDTFDEIFNVELMYALKEDGQRFAALMQYQHVTSAYYKYLGVEPTERILNFYKGLIKSELSTKADIDTIRQNLIDDAGDDSGAFVCDYSIFKDIYNLQRRNIARQNNKMFISLVTVSSSDDSPFEPLVLDSIMMNLLETFQLCLRKGDTISRYSPSQYAILLPMVNHASGDVVMARVRKMFYKKHGDSKIKITFNFGLIDSVDSKTTIA